MVVLLGPLRILLLGEHQATPAGEIGMATGESKTVIYAAMAGNCATTGSSAMLSGFTSSMASHRWVK
jgi:hypothetical protein